MSVRLILNPVLKYMQWDYAPKKGGSKSTSETRSTSRTAINEDFQPVVDQGLSDLKSMYDQGKLGQVAGESELQQMVFDRAESSLDRGMEVMDSARSTYEDAMRGTGLFDELDIEGIKQATIDEARLESGLMDDQIAKAGLLGSARSRIAAGDQEAQMANALAELEFNQRNLVQERAMWGADSMMTSGTGEATLLQGYAGLGDMQRQIEQEMLDADAKGLENYLAGMQVFTPLMTETVQESRTKQKQKQGK